MLYQRAVSRATAFPFPSCQKVWAHRGYAPDGGENSLQSVRGAFGRGAAGVEIDILFDLVLDDFVVSHDLPAARHSSKALKLEAVLAESNGVGYFWLDAKNLRKLSPIAARRATRRLASLIEHYRLQERAFVESSNALYLSWLANQGVYTSLTVSPNDRKYSRPLYRLQAAVTKLGYALVGSGAISMDVARYTPTTAATFGKAAVLLSTVNDRRVLANLSEIPQVKVILTDGDDYKISACAEPTS